MEEGREVRKFKMSRKLKRTKFEWEDSHIWPRRSDSTEFTLLLETTKKKANKIYKTIF